MTTLAHQFEDIDQQHEAGILGMWTFLATEVLFFGGLLLSYAIYRYNYQHAWFVGSHHLKEVLGAINTAVLLTSSLTMALAVRFSRAQRRAAVIAALVCHARPGHGVPGDQGNRIQHRVSRSSHSRH